MMFDEDEDLIKLTKEEQREVAAKQMEMLGLRTEAIQQFKSCGTLYKSINSRLLPLTRSEEQIIRDWENRFSDLLVYHVISNTMIFGELKCRFLNLLYVSIYEHDEDDPDPIIYSEYAGNQAASLYSYCINLDISEYSEFGPITVINEKGILKRVI